MARRGRRKQGQRQQPVPSPRCSVSLLHFLLAGLRSLPRPGDGLQICTHRGHPSHNPPPSARAALEGPRTCPPGRLPGACGLREALHTFRADRETSAVSFPEKPAEGLDSALGKPGTAHSLLSALWRGWRCVRPGDHGPPSRLLWKPEMCSAPQLRQSSEEKGVGETANHFFRHYPTNKSQPSF